MLKFKKRMATIIFLTFLSASTLVSCGKQANTEEGSTEEAADSAEHPSDSTATEHPADSTNSQ